MVPEPADQSVIPVAVSVAEKYRGLLADGQVRERCEAYLRELLVALRLPARAQLAVTADAELAAHDDVRVTIHETPVGARAAQEPDVDGLVELITSTLCRCRTLLLNDTVIGALWSTLFAGAGPVWSRPPPAGFADLCRELVRRGIGPARARGHRESIQRAAQNGDDLMRVVEEVMARPERAAIRLLVSEEMYRQCYDEAGKARALPGEDQDCEGMWQLMTDGLFWERGVVYRVAGMQPDPGLVSPWFQIAWHDMVTPPMRGLASGEFLVNDTLERLRLLGDAGVEHRAVAFNPANGNECTRVRGSEAARKICDQAGLTTWGPQGCLILAVTAELRRNAGAFVTTQLTALFETQLERAFPELVREARARFSREELTRILRCLSDEDTSIRDLRTILEALLAIIGVTTADVGRDIVFTGRTGLIYPVPEGQSLADLRSADYADAVRMALKRYVSHLYSRGSGTLVVYLLDPALEARLSGQEAMAATDRQQVLEAIGETLGAHARRAPPAVILTTHYARRRLREMVQYDFPGVAVLSYQELAPDLNIQPIARIGPPAKPAVRKAEKG